MLNTARQRLICLGTWGVDPSLLTPDLHDLQLSPHYYLQQYVLVLVEVAQNIDYYRLRISIST
jgi:hypothetical protein